MPTTRRLALAGVLALLAGALPHLPASAEATPAIVFRNAGNHSGGASVDIDIDASLGATGVRYSLADGTGHVDSFVSSLLSPDAASLVVDPLRNGRDYTLTAQLVADNTPVGAPVSTALRGVPRAHLFLGTTRQAKGATLPFTVQLSAISAVPVAATLQVDWAEDVSTSVPVTVAAGSLTADGSIAVPSGLFADAARHPVTVTLHAAADVLDGSEAVRSTAVWGSQSPTPITLTAAAVSLPEGDEPYTNVTITAKIDAAPAAPGFSIGAVSYEGSGAGWLSFPAGQKSASFDTVVPADTVPSGDHVQVFGFDEPPSGGPVLLPASVKVTTVDDDPDGAVPQVDVWSYGSQRGTGVSMWAGVTFVNAGNRTLGDAKVTGEIAAAAGAGPAALLRRGVHGRGPHGRSRRRVLLRRRNPGTRPAGVAGARAVPGGGDHRRPVHGPADGHRGQWQLVDPAEGVRADVRERPGPHLHGHRRLRRGDGHRHERGRRPVRPGPGLRSAAAVAARRG